MSSADSTSSAPLFSWEEVSKRGAFVRSESQFRNRVGDHDFPAESGRYHLYVSYACPWACRTLMVRQLKGLEDVISVSVVHWHLTEKGWHFEDEMGLTDHIHGVQYLRQIYEMAHPGYQGKVTVPVLFDTVSNRIVNNESSEIIRMLNSQFQDFAKHPEVNLYPEEFQDEIDEINEWVYSDINNGVYKSGFAKTQEAYEDAVRPLFASLDRVERILSKKRYLVGDQLTEADVRLFTTLIRFDVVYVGHFKCNLRRIEDYPHLSNYVRDIYQTGALADTVNFEHIKNHYYHSHRSVNPTGIIPVGPEIDFSTPHNRALL